MDFELAGPIRRAQTIAAGRGVREGARLRRVYGKGSWRKMKAVTRVRLRDGSVHRAEAHWYEADAVGRRELKLKLPLLD